MNPNIRLLRPKDRRLGGLVPNIEAALELLQMLIVETEILEPLEHERVSDPELGA